MSNEKDSEKEKFSWSWAEIMACSYCKHYQWVGTHAATQFCQNKESPYFDKNQPSWPGVYLNAEQEFKGCEKIEHNGEKMRFLLMKIIPKDSYLRKIPLEHILDAIPKDFDFSCEHTCNELSQKFEQDTSAMIEIMEKHKGLKLDKDGYWVTIDTGERVSLE